ncbi:hypothetical protein QBC38DRAFT_124423 [Podospora fimiseda]|uniref:Uncharacterized protein n=1 Tax=Podospora fimiseda TaxID=252190 RepID=A0AAN7H646_9PEZI|nr:hypothetical protein QBC38DRAFT_124423 [Podospora fimiseda]
MAVGFETLERLEKGLDRLERFFSKKKRVAPHEFVFTEALPATARNGFIPTFPSPSFIRPTSSRMVAREEVTLPGRLARRAHSLPGATASPSLMSIDSSISPAPSRQLSVSSGCPQIPHRTSSTSRPTSTSMEELMAFSFDKQPNQGSDNNLRPCRRSRSGTNTWSRCSSASVSPGAPVTRKRRSIQEEQSLPPTPPLSPRLIPLPDPTPDEFEMDLDLEYQVPTTPDTDLVPPPLCISSKAANPVLKEPTVDDFLSLSDDDIADGHAMPQPRTLVSTSKPPRFSLPPNPPSKRTSLLASSTYPFLTLSPPLASRPAAEAALEAAKLAAKYQFDLVYIVNLWPKDMGSSRRASQTTPSPPASPISRSNSSLKAASRPFGPRNSHRATNNSALTGRLLAAYGLTSLMFPFRISEPVHQKVLQTDGWLEYRGDSHMDYFTRGYSCSFYTGHSPDRRDRRRTQQQAAANRGIVFAAYRRPAADGSCIQTCPAELEDLYHDAEELVDMLLDIHMTHRRPSVTPPLSCVEENGPLGLSGSKMTLVAA